MQEYRERNKQCILTLQRWSMAVVAEIWSVYVKLYNGPMLSMPAEIHYNVTKYSKHNSIRSMTMQW